MQLQCLSLHNDWNANLYLVMRMFGFIILGICCLHLCKAEYVHENISTGLKERFTF